MYLYFENDGKVMSSEISENPPHLTCSNQSTSAARYPGPFIFLMMWYTPVCMQQFKKMDWFAVGHHLPEKSFAVPLSMFSELGQIQVGNNKLGGWKSYSNIKHSAKDNVWDLQ